MEVGLPAGVTTGVGSLPHRDAARRRRLRAAALARAAGDPEPAAPVAGRGDAGPGGRRHPRRVDRRRRRAPGRSAPRRPPRTVAADLDHDAFGGLRAFLEAAAGRAGSGEVAAHRADHARPGPLPQGRAGQHGVRRRGAGRRGSTCAPSTSAVAQALPGCPQVVVLDEPGLTALLRPDFPLAADSAIDLVSGALAAVEADGHGRRPPLRRRRPGGHPRHRSGHPVAAGAPGPGGRGRLPRLVPRRRRLDRLGRGAHRPAGRHRRGPLLARAGRAVVRAGAGRLQPGAAPRARASSPRPAVWRSTARTRRQRVLRLVAEVADRVRAQAVATSSPSGREPANLRAPPE